MAQIHHCFTSWNILGTGVIFFLYVSPRYEPLSFNIGNIKLVFAVVVVVAVVNVALIRADTNEEQWFDLEKQ